MIMTDNMMWDIIEVIASVVECFLLTNYVVNFFDYKVSEKEGKKYFYLLFMTILNNIVISQVISIDSVTGILQIAIVYFYLRIYMNGSELKKIFVSFTSVFLILIINSITLASFNWITHKNMEVLITSNGIFRIMILFITKFLYFISTIVLIKMFKNPSYSVSKTEWIYIISMFSVTVLIGSFTYEYEIRYEEANSVLFNLMFLTMIMLNIFSYVFIRKMCQNNLKRGTSLFINKKQKDDDTSGNLTKESKSLIDVEYLIKNKFYNEADEYIERACKDIIRTEQNSFEKNELIDIVTGIKKYICVRNKTDVTFTNMSSLYGFMENDICLILSVIFDELIILNEKCDNSIRAEILMKDKNNYLNISIKIKSRNNLIYDNMKSYVNSIMTDDVKKLIKKYSGAVSFNNSSDVVTVDLFLNQNASEDYDKKSLLMSEER